MLANPKSSRIFGLDLMRAIAILMVLFGHCVWIIPKNDSFWHKLLVLFGFFGVEIFFVLSGFLIGKILYQSYLKEDYSIKVVFSFLKRRWFRTFPNYFLILLVNLAIASIVGYATLSWWKYFFFLQNINTTMLPFFPESWSLSVEEFAYVTLPFFLLFFGSFVKPKVKSHFFVGSVITLIVIFFCTKIYYQSTTQNTTLTQWNLSLKAVVIYRLDSIFIGVLYSWIYLNYTSFWQKNKVVLFVVGMFLFFFQFVGIGYLGWFIESVPVFWNVFYLPLISIAIACFLPYLSEWKNEKSLFHKPVTFISLISYSIYLLHYSVILLLMKQYIVIDEQNNIQLVTFLSSYILITILLSYFLYRFYEKPIMNLRDKN
ncbi:acyltransferase family protein [Flavobacterium sp.]|uniref:acyltransferase family protein n=1 Tax=Flavobacterium sp. TaxID=239 RepID=UPI00391C2860